MKELGALIVLALVYILIKGGAWVLDLAKVSYSYSETSSELIAKIVLNSNKIRVAATSPRTTK